MKRTDRVGQGGHTASVLIAQGKKSHCTHTLFADVHAICSGAVSTQDMIGRGKRSGKKGCKITLACVCVCVCVFVVC